MAKEKKAAKEKVQKVSGPRKSGKHKIVKAAPVVDGVVVKKVNNNIGPSCTLTTACKYRKAVQCSMGIREAGHCNYTRWQKHMS
jgi:ribosomal protein S25